jgi:hypothetical protein
LNDPAPMRFSACRCRNLHGFFGRLNVAFLLLFRVFVLTVISSCRFVSKSLVDQ